MNLRFFDNLRTLGKIETIFKNPNGLALCILAFYFLSFMTKSDSFYEPYLLVGILGLFAFYKNKKKEQFKIGKLEFCFASFLTICILLANYKILNITLSNGKIAFSLALLNLLVLVYGIYMLFRNILVFLSTLQISDFRASNSKRERERERERARKYSLFRLCYSSYVIS